jgi:phosphate uptake regulator
MKRKIIKQGHNTLTMTLPSKWVKKLNLKPGDEIDLTEKDNILVVNGEKQDEDKKCIIDISDFTVPLLWRYFQSAYRSGCNEIKIVFDPNKKEYQDAYHYYTTLLDYAKLGEKMPPKPAIAMIQDVVNRFVGIDIVESGDGYCIIRELGMVSEKEFDKSLRRIFLTVLSMFDRLIEAIEKNEINDPNLCKELHAIDLNVDKLVDYCARILNKTNSFPESRRHLMFSTLFLLELVGDEFKYVGKHFAFSKKTLKELLEFLKEIKGHFDMYYKLYYNFNLNMAIEFGKKDIDVYQRHFMIKNKVQGESRSVMKHLMMISKLTLGLTELRIEMEH